MAANHIDVLIIGAGPTGLMLACELARAGVSFRIIDRKEGTSKFIKATALSGFSLEIFADFDYVDRFIETGVQIDCISFYTEGKLKVDAPWFGAFDRFPFYFIIGQKYVEKFQEELLTSLGGQIEWNTELVGLDGLAMSDETVQATVTSGQQEKTINAKYVIGCDGSRSMVREWAAIEMQKKKYPDHYIIADVDLEADLQKHQWYFFALKHGFLSVAPLPEGRWGILYSLPRGQEYARGETPTLSDVQEALELAPLPMKSRNPEWISHFHTVLGKVDRRRSGRAILCGDAAHQVSPLTALGMNSGILDARNLGWKLAAVIRGADDILFDSYEIEQEQTIQKIRQLSNISERGYNPTGWITRESRDHLMPMLLALGPVQRSYGATLAQADATFSNSPITKQHVGKPVHGRQATHLSDEGWCIKAWAHFGRGPHPGHLAPNLQGIVTEKDRQPAWLYDSILHGKHSMILFLGQCPLSDRCASNLAEIVSSTLSTYSDYVSALCLSVDEQIPENLATCKGLVTAHDPDSILHNSYGAYGDCIYIVRPDGFVGFRCLPPVADRIAEYWQNVLPPT
ncbi:MAG: FAD-dependent monooxygenase [Planctomycetales bacterium]